MANGSKHRKKKKEECPLEVCIQRDPKGIYRKAREGSISSLPGIQGAYEEPISPDLTIESAKT